MKTKSKHLKGLNPATKRYDVKLPDEGLYARVFPSGKIAVQYVYRFDYLRRRITLGHYPAVSLAVLEREYYLAKASRSRGDDPQMEKVEKRQVKKEAAVKVKLAKSISELGLQFVEDHSERNKAPQSAREDLRILKREVIPHIGSMKVGEIERRHLAEIVNRITRRGSPVMANRVKAFLSKLFNYAIDNGVIETNPAFRLPSNKEVIRQRVLNDEELHKLWLVIDKLDNEAHQAAIRVLLLTGQRRGEVAKMKRDEIEGDWWVIPPERSKNRIAHRVPLSSIVKRYIKGESQWVFPGRRSNYIHPDTLTDCMPELIKLAGIGHCTVHDLRRTVGTYIQTYYGSDVMHKVLNHKDDRLTATYGVHAYDKEKKKALLKWARHIGNLSSKIGGSNVISL